MTSTAEEIAQLLEPIPICDHHHKMIRSYHVMSMIACQMRLKCKINANNIMPASFYTFCLAPSGSGKGYARTILNQLISAWEEKYMVNLESMREPLYEKLKNQNPSFKDTDDVKNYSDSMGVADFELSGATVAGLAQIHAKLQVEPLGGINLSIDEIGDVLSKNRDMFSVLAQIWDDGQYSISRIKNTMESVNTLSLRGGVTSCGLFFGSGSALLDSNVIEEIFLNMLKSGMARRCFFSYIDSIEPPKESPENRWNSIRYGKKEYELKLTKFIKKFSNKSKANIEIQVSDEAGLLMIQYEDESRKQSLEKFVDEIIEIELNGRAIKALRLATVIAFFDESKTVEKSHMMEAIETTTQSSLELLKIIKRPPIHQKIAEHLVRVGESLTEADLIDSFKGLPKAKGPRRDTFELARSWGSSLGIIVKIENKQGLIYLSADKLEETNQDQLIVSLSMNMADNYRPKKLTWSKFKEMVTYTSDGKPLNFCTHHFRNDHRSNSDVLMPFNIIVFDFDGDEKMNYVESVFSNYRYLIYTTKSHMLTSGDKANQERFRLVVPLSHIIKMSKDEYKEAMSSLTGMLPVEHDVPAFADIARKWECNAVNSTVKENEGILFPAQLVIPVSKVSLNTKKRVRDNKKHGNAAALITWFFDQHEGKVDQGKNNILYRFTVALRDESVPTNDIRTHVSNLNDTFNPPMKLNRLTAIFKAHL